jgi:hypothetical protein
VPQSAGLTANELSHEESKASRPKDLHVQYGAGKYWINLLMCIDQALGEVQDRGVFRYAGEKVR